jgi:mono/diheme cytochrome c family protein
MLGYHVAESRPFDQAASDRWCQTIQIGSASAKRVLCTQFLPDALSIATVLENGSVHASIRVSANASQLSDSLIGRPGRISARSKIVAQGVVAALGAALLPLYAAGVASAEETPAAEPAKAISYDADVMPIFRKACFGCHQSGKRMGDYLMTDFAALTRGGETGETAIVPGNPDASYLVSQITPVDGHAEMPKAPFAALSQVEVDTIRDWIAKVRGQRFAHAVGADVRRRKPAGLPKRPVVTSVDVSADGKWIAAAGHHEVILIDAATGETAGRLIGMSPRINTVRFSPDSSRLAVAAGTPAESGELQVWDVASRELKLSLPVGSDTLSGARWSPDGTQIAFGSVNIVRGVNAETGEEVLFQGAHEDWVLDTVFTVDGGHLVSIARDMTCKLTEVATQRFIDNVTSITPGHSPAA